MFKHTAGLTGFDSEHPWVPPLTPSLASSPVCPSCVLCPLSAFSLHPDSHVHLVMQPRSRCTALRTPKVPHILPSYQTHASLFPNCSSPGPLTRPITLGVGPSLSLASRCLLLLTNSVCAVQGAFPFAEGPGHWFFFQSLILVGNSLWHRVGGGGRRPRLPTAPRIPLKMVETSIPPQTLSVETWIPPRTLRTCWA